MRLRCIELICAALCCATPAGAQLVYIPLDSATIVRLHLARGERVSGRLLAPFGPDSTRFVWCPARRAACRPDARPRVTPAAQVRRVEVRRGHRSKQGAVIGAVTLVGAAATYCALTNTGDCDPSRGGFVSFVALPTALVGAALGAVVGSSVPKWAPAP